MKFCSSMWARKVTKWLHIPSFSYIDLNTKTSSFFITGGPWDREKFDIVGVNLCGKLFVNFDSVHSEGYIVTVLSDFLAKFELTTRVSNKNLS